MDVHLPGISGIDAFEQLAADTGTQQIPVVAVTEFDGTRRTIEVLLQVPLTTYTTQVASWDAS